MRKTDTARDIRIVNYYGGHSSHPSRKAVFDETSFMRNICIDDDWPSPWLSSY